jgi:hypothetical protein
MGMNDGTISASQWWRWPLMPFAAVIGGALGATLFTGLQWLGMKFQGGFAEDGWMFMYVLPMISTAAFGYLYAYISCTVAPRAKFIAGVAMTAVLGALSAFVLVVFWLNPSYAPGRAIFETVKLVLGMAGAVIALMQLHDELR